MTTLGAGDIVKYVRAAGFTGPDVVIMTAIVLAESGGKTDAINDNGGSKDWGLAQINDKAHPDLFAKYPNIKTDPDQNLQAAHDVYAQAGNSFSPWVTFHNKDSETGQPSYMKFLVQAQQGAGQSGGTADNPVEGTTFTDSNKITWTFHFLNGKTDINQSEWVTQKSDGNFYHVAHDGTLLITKKNADGTFTVVNGYTAVQVTTDPAVRLLIGFMGLGTALDLWDQVQTNWAHTHGGQTPGESGFDAVKNALFAGLGPALWIGGGALLVLLGLVMLAKNEINPVTIAKAIA